MPSTTHQTHQILAPAQVSWAQSTKIMSNFVKTFISEILLQRARMDAESFRSVNMSGMNLHVLKRPESVEDHENDQQGDAAVANRSNDVDLYNKMKKYLAGIDDALEKKYLRLIIIAFHNPQESPSHNFDTIAEAYEIHIKYLDNNMLAMSWNVQAADSAKGDGQNTLPAKELTTEDIKTSLHSIFRNLDSFISVLNPLPPNAFFTIKLAYTPDTPMDYEPCGFEKCVPASVDHYRSMPVSELGMADSKFHTSSVVFRCQSDALEGEQDVAPVIAGDHLDVHTEPLSALSAADAEEFGGPPTTPAPPRIAPSKSQTKKQSEDVSSVIGDVPTCNDPVIQKSLSNYSDKYLAFVYYALSGEYISVPKFSEAFGMDKRLGYKIVRRLISDGLVKTDSKNKRAGRKTIPNSDLKKRIEKHFSELRKNGIEVYTPTPEPIAFKPSSKKRKRDAESSKDGSHKKPKKIPRLSKNDDEALDFDASNADEFTFIPDQKQKNSTGKGKKIPSLVPPVEPRRLRLNDTE